MGELRREGGLPLLDTVREVHTPEGVALHLPAAGAIPRAYAWLLDLAIRGALLALVSIILRLLGAFGAGVYAIVLFFVVWAYYVAFEALWDGQTPGKRALGLRVVAVNGAPIGWMASFVRNLLRTVDMLPFGYGAGLACSLSDPWGRRLGDIVAGTVVVHASRERHATPPAIASIHAPAMPLQPGEQAAVIAFADRANTLTPQRQQELADIAAPATGTTGEAGVIRLFGIANWLLGRRP
ncbi:MAG: RDD family protein [Luteimonas sp.]|nr:RDD family protein [Luteimonas sp.]